ncbi:MAG: hypothetical protein ACU83P_00930 [Gammaproteobacteria bacterium]
MTKKAKGDFVMYLMRVFTIGLSTSFFNDGNASASVHRGNCIGTRLPFFNPGVLAVADNPAPRWKMRSLLNIYSGAFKSSNRPPCFLAVDTPYVNDLIEGAEFPLPSDGDSTSAAVHDDGKALTCNDQGQLFLTHGASAIAKAGRAPEPFISCKPRNAVQWTLHIPPLLSALRGDGGDFSVAKDFGALQKR